MNKGPAIAIISIMVALTIITICLSKETHSRYQEDLKKREMIISNLGKRVVIEKDTLTIVDYTRNTYILSNKTSINQELLPKIILK